MPEVALLKELSGLGLNGLLLGALVFVWRAWRADQLRHEETLKGILDKYERALVGVTSVLERLSERLD